MSRFVFVFVLLCEHSLSQMIPNSPFVHERLMLGSSFAAVRQQLLKANRALQEQSANPFLKKDAATFLVSYSDTIFGKRIGVSLAFTKMDSTLQSIMVMFLGIDPQTRKQVIDAEQAIKMLWDSLSTRWGQPTRNSSIPLVGKKREWLFPSAEVQLLHLTAGTSMLTVTYASPK
ncbi:MAG: hypothetical protein FJ215_08795 [Ignavibacteria bacterium]|nr:hypothetical protein [Ignavibacteria bacterium]